MSTPIEFLPKLSEFHPLRWNEYGFSPTILHRKWVSIRYPDGIHSVLCSHKYWDLYQFTWKPRVETQKWYAFIGDEVKIFVVVTYDKNCVEREILADLRNLKQFLHANSVELIFQVERSGK